MAIDNNQDYKEIKSKIGAYKKTIKSKKDTAQKKKDELGDNFAKSQEKHFSNLNEWGDTAQAYTDEKKKLIKDTVTSQLDQLTEIFMISAKEGEGEGSQYETTQKLTQLYNDTILSTKSKIAELWIQEGIKAIGCSEEQTYELNDIYIRVESIDLFKTLKDGPNESPSNLRYERFNTANGTIPFSMNRELFERTQNAGVPLTNYIGASSNAIMDISYETQDNFGNQGNFYKISMKNRPDQINRVTEFLYDYYMSIELVNIDELITNIIDYLSGAISFEMGVGSTQLDQMKKFQIVLQRILGLCFDNQKEIDVSGIAKLSVNEQIDDTFFQMSSIDLRNIESEIDNIKKGVVEFTDCNNVKLPMKAEETIQFLQDIRDNFNTDGEKLEQLSKFSTEIGDNEDWNFLLPNLNFKLSIQQDLIKVIPTAIMATLLSPKNLLGLFAMFKALGNTFVDQIQDLEEFMNRMKTFLVEVMSKIGALFVEELFNAIKQNVDSIILALLNDIRKESQESTVRIVTSVLSSAMIVASLISDWRRCKSVIDELLALLQLAVGRLNLGLPLFILALAGSLPGVSETRTFARIIEELEKAGLPTDDLPDGSPNLMLQSVLSQIKGAKKEKDENEYTEIYIPPLTMTPAGVTLPSKGVGKSK
jgi:hypothetical protein